MSENYTKEYTIAEKIEYYKKRINDKTLSLEQRKYAFNKVQSLSSIKPGSIVKSETNKIPGMRKGNEKFHHVVINEIDKNENYSINAISHTKFEDFIKVKIDPSKKNDIGYVNTKTYDQYKNGSKINSFNTYESKYQNNLSMEDFEKLKRRSRK